MASRETTRWTLTVSKDTDSAVRALLEETERQGTDLSAFVEEAVRWRLFDRTLAEVRGRFSDLEPEALQDLIDETIASVRAA